MMCGPRHTLSNAARRRLLATQHISGYLRNAVQSTLQSSFGSKGSPSLVVQLGSSRRNKFSQSLASSKPHTRCHLSSRINVGEVGKTYFSLFTPAIHGIDSLPQVGTAGFFDAAGVNPQIRYVHLECFFAGISILESPSCLFPHCR